jgi:hypothetical protein
LEKPLFLWPFSRATLNYQRVAKNPWIVHEILGTCWKMLDE